jgi:signal transduction histidine kinase
MSRRAAAPQNWAVVVLLLAVFAGLGLIAVGAAARGLRRAVRRRWARTAQLTAAADDARRAQIVHATLEERARIARELHDVVAHHISMIAVQAEAARLLTPDLAPEGQRRLVEIGDTARSALTEMRRLLGVLREDHGDDDVHDAHDGPHAEDADTPGRTALLDDSADRADRRPQPSLAELTELVDDARARTGTSVRLIVRGPVVPLDPGVELSAYRIVQEALTNARRHAPGAAVDVELDYRPDALGVRVRDSGLATRPGSAGAGGGPGGARIPGLGLTGMRERAAMVGGELTVGAVVSGGFVVTATLPRSAATAEVAR